jgi:small subunit ribosomal protein S8
MPASTFKSAIAHILKDEGYISEVETSDVSGKPELKLQLKYFNGKAVIDEISRVSRPGLRIYKNKDELPVVRGGLGVAIVSTSQGLMSDKLARKKGLGGEVICYVS